MNVPQIIGLRFTSPIAEQRQTNQNITSNFGLIMAKPLSKDTVSFKSTAKAANRAYGATKEVAVAAAAYAEGRQSEIVRFAKKYFGDLFRIKGMSEPEKSIGTVKARSKSWSSILDKSGSGKWESFKDIVNNMTDLNGMKFVLDTASRKDMKAFLNRWGQLVKKGIIELDEIEIKRPKVVEKLKGNNPEKYIYDYAEEESLKKLAQIQYETTGKSLLNKEGNIPVDYTKGNYPALHMLAHFPGAKHGFEIQVVDMDVDTYKGLNDIFWKVLNGKNVDKKYAARFNKRLAPLMEETEESQKLSDKFTKYSGDVFLFQRLRKSPTQTKKGVDFPPPIYDLPENLYMNELWRLKTECEAVVTKTKTKKK